MRGDPVVEVVERILYDISTHSPRAGRSPRKSNTSGFKVISTHSPRAGRSVSPLTAWTLPFYFNSLAPCGAIPNFDAVDIAILLFQLTRPVRGDPRWRCGERRLQDISTHSPRAGRSRLGGGLSPVVFYFNSLAPCGAIRPTSRNHRLRPKFQLTRPVRGDPNPSLTTTHTICISTHSPRAGRSFMGSSVVSNGYDFNSLAPCGAILVFSDGF